MTNRGIIINPGSHVPVEPGFWLAIVVDLLFFSLLFVAILSLRYESDGSYNDFAIGASTLNITVGLINTLVLMTRSFLIARAVVFYRSLQYRKAKRQILLAISLGCTFVFLKCFEYFQKYEEGSCFETGRFCEIYYSSTGVHLVHVTVGILLLSVVARACSQEKKKMKAGLSKEWLDAVACYWHLVDFLWFVLFALFYVVIP